MRNLTNNGQFSTTKNNFTFINIPNKRKINDTKIKDGFHVNKQFNKPSCTERMERKSSGSITVNLSNASQDEKKEEGRVLEKSEEAGVDSDGDTDVDTSNFNLSSENASQDDKKEEGTVLEKSEEPGVNSDGDTDVDTSNFNL